MICWSSSTSPISRPVAKPPHALARLGELEAGAQRVGPEAPKGRIVSQLRLAGQAQDLAAGLSGHREAGRQPQPRHAVREPPVRGDPPAPVHPQMAVDHSVAGEVGQQMLATGLGALERAALQLGGATVERRARVRRVGELELAAGERAVESVGGAMDRVALGHPTKLVRGRL